MIHTMRSARKIFDCAGASQLSGLPGKDIPCDFGPYFYGSSDCMAYLHLEPDGRLVYAAVNAAALSAVGLGRHDMLGRTPQEVLGSEHTATMAEALLSVCRTGTPYRSRPTLNRPHGETWFDAVYTPHADNEGNIVGVVCIARNITKEKSLEKSLDHLARISALGKLSSGVAHDFISLLANIRACFSLLGRQVETEKGKHMIAEGKRMVIFGLERANSIMTFAHEKTAEPNFLDINNVVLGAKSMLERALLPVVAVELKLSPLNLPSIRGGASQIELTLLNLAQNSRDAMPNGGTLTIETRSETLSADDAGLLAGEYVVVSLSDSGQGMSPEVLANALKPFYTTKRVGKGTGLGLSMANDMVSELGGKIDVTSKVGVGTCVSLYFPCAAVVKV